MRCMIGVALRDSGRIQGLQKAIEVFVEAEPISLGKRPAKDESKKALSVGFKYFRGILGHPRRLL
jgi:hypothetical protein